MFMDKRLTLAISVALCLGGAATARAADLPGLGKPISEAMRISQAFLELMQSRGEHDPDEGLLEDAVAFAGVSKYPARIKCALLGWMAWKDATAQALEVGR